MLSCCFMWNPPFLLGLNGEQTVLRHGPLLRGTDVPYRQSYLWSDATTTLLTKAGPVCCYQLFVCVFLSVHSSASWDIVHISHKLDGRLVLEISLSERDIRPSAKAHTAALPGNQNCCCGQGVWVLCVFTGQQVSSKSNTWHVSNMASSVILSC